MANPGSAANGHDFEDMQALDGEGLLPLDKRDFLPVGISVNRRVL